jgi:hypothetical protein
MTTEDTQQSRAHHIELAATAIAEVVEWTAGEEFLPAILHIKELKKEHQLAFTSHRSLAFPLSIKPLSGGCPKANDQ